MPNRDNQASTTAVAAVVGVGIGAALLWYFTQVRGRCTEGATKCEGYDLYKCKNGEWVLIEENSEQCGWEPPEPEGDVTGISFNVR